jgi:cytochrome c biogenesis protein CcdA
MSGLFLLATAFLAGVVGFPSPCCLPRFPGTWPTSAVARRCQTLGA